MRRRYQQVVLFVVLVLVVRSGVSAKKQQITTNLGITGGFIAKPGQFSYQVLLNVISENGLFQCGGSLIKRNTILTAAHCVDKAIGILVLLGDKDTRGDSKTRLSMQAQQWIAHENYSNSADAINYDIGLIFLPSKISLNANISIVPMLNLNLNSFVGHIVTVSGWGKMGQNETSSRYLRYTTVQLISNSKCLETWTFIDNRIICAQTPSKNQGRPQSACQGDSGGPLTCSGFLIGVVSFGSDNCEDKNPTGYTRIQPFLKWISQKIKNFEIGLK